MCNVVAIKHNPHIPLIDTVHLSLRFRNSMYTHFLKDIFDASSTGQTVIVPDYPEYDQQEAGIAGGNTSDNPAMKTESQTHRTTVPPIPLTKTEKVTVSIMQSIGSTFIAAASPTTPRSGARARGTTRRRTAQRTSIEARAAWSPSSRSVRPRR